MILRPLYSLCLALNKTGYSPYQFSNLCQAIVLLFFRIYGVRHRFMNKIKYIDCIIYFLEKHWRACKRVALPTEL